MLKRWRNVCVVRLRGYLLDSDLEDGYGWGEVDPYQIFYLREFKLKVRDMRSYRELLKLFKKNFLEELVIATDNDPEGELL